MKETKTIAKAANFTATDFGKMSEIKDYTLELGPEIKIPGKVFGGQSVNATGGEFSFQSFAPGTETGFLHTQEPRGTVFLPQRQGRVPGGWQGIPSSGGKRGESSTRRQALRSQQRYRTTRDALRAV